MELINSETDSEIIVQMEGKFTFKDHPVFNNFMEEAKERKKNLVFDLSNLELIDSAGIGMLFLAQKLLEEHHKKVSLLNPIGQVKRTLEITDVSKQIRVVFGGNHLGGA